MPFPAELRRDDSRGSRFSASWEGFGICVGVSLRRRLAIAVRSIGRDPHSAHLLPQDGYSRARNVCGLLDAGVVDLSHERLGPRESCHAHLCARRSLSSGHQHRGVIDVTTQLQRSLTPYSIHTSTGFVRIAGTQSFPWHGVSAMRHHKAVAIIFGNW